MRSPTFTSWAHTAVHAAGSTARRASSWPACGSTIRAAWKARVVTKRLPPSMLCGLPKPHTASLRRCGWSSRLARFGRDLEPNGLNLEGLAVVGGMLYAGLRAPSLDGSAFIVSTDVEPLFTPDTPLVPRVIPLALGRDTGIRDLALLPDGRLLVLAGPAQDQLDV